LDGRKWAKHIFIHLEERGSAFLRNVVTFKHYTA